MSLSEKQKNHGSKLVGLTMIPGVQDCITEWTRVNGEYDEWQVLERAWAAVVTYATAHQAQAAQELARCSRSSGGGQAGGRDLCGAAPMKTEAEIQEAANMLARLLVNGGAESRTIAGELVALEWVLGNDHPNHAGSLTRLLDTLRQEGLPR